MTDTKTIVIDTTSGENVGDIIYFDGTNWTRLSIGPNGYYLKSNGASAPSWEEFVDAASGDVSGNFPNLQVNDLTIAGETQGSILYYNGSNWVRLAPGTNNYVLTTKGVGSNPTWQQPQVFTTTATGDVSGTYPSLQVNDLTISGEQEGSLLYYDGISWSQLTPGSDGYVLATNGVGGAPFWKEVQDINGAIAGGDLSGNYPNPQIAAGAIINADINTSAAIAYSKLNLSNSILDADLNSSANINVSKLNGESKDGYYLQAVSGVPTWIQIPTDNTNDGYAIHNNISNEIAAITNIIPTLSDFILIEDTDDGYTKKSSLIGNLPFATDSEFTTHTSDTTNPHNTDVGNLGSGTLAELNAIITDATLDTNTASRPPNGSAGGDLSGTYPNPEVNDLTIAGEAQGDLLYFDGSGWEALAAGDDGYKLIAKGTGASPVWEYEPYIQLIYKPGASAVGNIYTDLASLQTAIQNVSSSGRFGEVIFDGSQSSNNITIDSNLELYNIFGIRCVNVDDLFIDDITVYNARYFKSDHMVTIEAVGSVGTTYMFTFDGTTGAVESSYVPYFENINYFNNVGGVNDRDLFVLQNATVIPELTLNNIRAKHNSIDNLLRVETDNGYTILNIYGENVGSSFFRVSDGPAGFLTINYYGDDEPVDNVAPWTETGSSFAINNMGKSGTPRRNFSQNDADAVAIYNFDKTGEDYNADSTLDLTFNSTPVYYPGHFRDSWSFAPSGSNYASNSDTSFRITGAITVEVILYLPALLAGGGDEKIISFSGINDNTEAENTLWALGLDDAATTIEVFHENGAGNNNIYNTGVACPTGEWVHIAFVRQSNGTDYELFLNGVSIGSSSVSNAPTGGTNGNLYVGSWFTSNQVFSGYISSVKISDATKSSDEIYESADAVLVADDKVSTFDTVADLRAGVLFPREGKVYYTLGQDTVGDLCEGRWLGVKGSPGTYTHDGMTMVVPSSGDGSLGLQRVGGSFLTPEVADNDVVSWYMPSAAPLNGGFLSVAANMDSSPFPANGAFGMVQFDVGNSPGADAVYARPSFAIVEGGVAPTGTTGTDGFVTLFVRTGIMHIENRFGSSMPYRVNLFN